MGPQIAACQNSNSGKKSVCNLLTWASDGEPALQLNQWTVPNELETKLLLKLPAVGPELSAQRETWGPNAKLLPVFGSFPPFPSPAPRAFSQSRPELQFLQPLSAKVDSNVTNSRVSEDRAGSTKRS